MQLQHFEDTSLCVHKGLRLQIEKSNLDFINNVDDWQEIKMSLDCDKETL